MEPSSPIPRTRIKVCGLRTPEHADLCARLGVDWIGLNFHRPSIRSIDPRDARALTERLPETTRAVGLFVDLPAQQVGHACELAGVHLIQLHGREPVELLRDLPPLPVIRAFRIGDVAAIAAMRDYVAEAEAIGHPLHAVLVDAYVPGTQGGTGHAIEDELLAKLPALPRLILAGGLNPENVRDRIDQVHPWMVDVASGVESAPGEKCPDRITAFVRAVGSPRSHS